jgi:hypothetical protein
MDKIIKNGENQRIYYCCSIPYSNLPDIELIIHHFGYLGYYIFNDIYVGPVW